MEIEEIFQIRLVCQSSKLSNKFEGKPYTPMADLETIFSYTVCFSIQ